MNNNDNEILDPRLKALLEELRQTPPRNPDVAAKGKAQFLAGVDGYLSALPNHGRLPIGARLFQKLGAIQPNLGHRTAWTALAAAIVILILFFGSAGMTALAAQSALPGDALYSIKTGLEETQFNLSSSSARQVALQLQYAQRRLLEIEKLIAEGRYDDIQIATQEFQRHLQSAVGSLKDVAANDPVRAAELATEITDQLTRYAQALAKMANGAPEPVRVELAKAAQVSQTGGLVKVNRDGEVEFYGIIENIGPEIWLIDGQKVRVMAQTDLKAEFAVGMLVKVHARRGADGISVAREIELAQIAPENGNANINEVEAESSKSTGDDELNNNSDHDNLNGNENRNDNDADNNQNSNQNSNDNDQDNDNSSGNENENSPANSNSNDNDHDDENRNSNDNQNRNGNDNSNDNSNDNRNRNENKNHNGYHFTELSVA